MPVETLSPNAYSRHHSMPRFVRAGSAEPMTIDPSNSLNESGSPKVSLASRFMRRQPTVDTYSFTKEEFEVGYPPVKLLGGVNIALPLSGGLSVSTQVVGVSVQSLILSQCNESCTTKHI